MRCDPRGLVGRSLVHLKREIDRHCWCGNHAVICMRLPEAALGHREISCTNSWSPM